MGNIGYIFGYAVIFAFMLGAIVGYLAKWIGDKQMLTEYHIIASFFRYASNNELIEIFGASDVNEIFKDYDSKDVLKKIKEYQKENKQ